MSIFPKDALLHKQLVFILILLNVIILYHAIIKDRQWYPALLFTGGILLLAIFKQIKFTRFFKK